MSGTPWHVEVLGSGDRRHRSRCSYYSSNSQFCRYYDETCRGSAHCPQYDEYVTAEERKHTHRQTTKHGDYSVTVVTSDSVSGNNSYKSTSRTKGTSLGKSFSSAANNINPKKKAGTNRKASAKDKYLAINNISRKKRTKRKKHRGQD